MSDLYLPTQGLYCVATMLPSGGFSHNFFYSIDDARRFAKQRDDNGFTVYIAQGTYRESTNRKATNVLALRSFFLDIDVGEKWKLKSQREAAQELLQFIRETGLPMPAVTNSGTGLYAHWPISEDIAPAQWRQVASYLKQVVAAYSEGLAGDSSRTADAASVLRPIGSHNRKGNASREVTAISHAEEIPLLDFVAALKAAGDRRSVTLAAATAPRKATNLNSEFEVSQNEVLDPRLIAAKCAQIGRIADLKGNVEEPLWYAMVGLIRFTTEGERYVHEWSTGHPSYSEHETNRKIQQHKDSGTGPTTCRWFHSLNAAGCAGCPHAPELKTPLFLGRPAPVPLPNVVETETGEETIAPPPSGFKRTDNGIVFTEGSESGGVHDLIVYPYDIYPLFSARDEGLGYETVTWRHYLPHEGWKEFSMRSALVADPKAFTMTLIDNHVHVPTAGQRTLMNAYASGYLAKLKANRKMTKLHTQMGWKDVDSAPYFVLGSRVLDGSGVDHVGMAANVPEIAKSFAVKGEIAPWVEQTRVFDEPGMAPLGFAFLAAAFGAPLMRFTGFEGALISLVGPSGVAKTLTCRWALSAYGDSKALMMLKDDTFNGLVARLGVYGNLPLVVDEVTNIDGAELSNVVYRVTQGRDKVRLTRAARERDSLNHWNTIGVVTTNASLYDRLTSTKVDASAEVNRLFEYQIKPCAALARERTSAIYETITNNYGGVGEAYLTHLVRDVRNLPHRLRAMMDRVAADTNALGEERFWTAMIAVAVTGGVLAKSLGLIDFEVGKVYRWATAQMKRNRNQRLDLVSSAEILLARFIDEHASNRLVVSVDGIGRNAITTVLTAPRGALVMMQDISPNSPDRHLYISRPVIRQWLHRQGADTDAVTQYLLEKGMILSTDRRRVLGRGTEYAGALQYCWMVPVDSTVVRDSLSNVAKLERKA